MAIIIMEGMKYEYDTRYYRIVKKIRVDSALSKTDTKYLDSCLKQYTGKDEAHASDSLKIYRKRHELRELAFRIMFKGERYADRDQATLPVWVDPDE